MLAVHCELSELGRSSLIMQQRISRDGLVLIEAQVKAAFVDAVSFKPIGMPTEIRHKIQLEKQ
jgi:acyl-CoA thioester hydrolase